jgi:hypothetical protein
MLEGYAYSTAAYEKRKYLNKALSVSAWKGRFRRYTGIGAEKSNEKPAESQPKDISYHWSLPPIEEMRMNLKGLLQREVRMLMVYAGNNQRYNYQGQFAEAFPDLDFKGLLQESRYDQSDHNFSMISDRERLYAEVAEWMGNFPR